MTRGEKKRNCNDTAASGWFANILFELHTKFYVLRNSHQHLLLYGYHIIRVENEMKNVEKKNSMINGTEKNPNRKGMQHSLRMLFFLFFCHWDYPGVRDKNRSLEWLKLIA